MTTKDMYSNIRPKKKYFYAKLAAFLGFMFIVAVIIYVFFINSDTVPEYVTVFPEIGTVESTVSASGTINATNEVKIGSQISGTISEVLAEENDIVKKGDILAIINPETIKQTITRYEAHLYSAKAALAASEASLANKKWNLEQLDKLYTATKGKSPSAFEMESARMDYQTALAEIEVKKAAIKEAETNLNSAKIDLKNSIIVSPVDGVILTRSIEAGQTVAASFSTPELFTVAENLEKMKLVVKVSEADVGKVSEGQEVYFTVDAYPDKNFRSVVDRVNMGASASDDNIVSYGTTIYIDNKEHLLRSGMSATADIVTESAHDVILVPIAAVYFNLEALESNQKKKSGGGFFAPPPMMRRGPITQEDRKIGKKGTLWIMDNNVPIKIDVLLGVSDGQRIEVIGDNIDTDTPVITGIKAAEK